MKTEDLRNVALLGHQGSGKTTLCESMLFEAGEIKRRGSIEEKNTQSDYTNIEKERQSSLFTSLMHVNWKNSKINIIDTPGADDFVGEVVAAMKVVDTAIMVLNSQSGVEVGTEILWEYVSNYQMPSIFIINQLDKEKADYERTITQAKQRFGPKVLAMQYPMETGPDFHRIIDVLQMTMYVFGPDGGKPEKHPIPDSEIAKANEMHKQIVEVAAEEDDNLMEIYFEQGTLSEDDLRLGLQKAVNKRDVYPVFCCSGSLNMGTGRVMGFINDIGPSPTDRGAIQLDDSFELLPDSSGPVTLFIYKTMTEPQVGSVSYFKIYAGTLIHGADLHNRQTGGNERFNQIYVSNGKNRSSVEQLVAGDIGVTVKLKNSHTNNTLNEKGVDIIVPPIQFPGSRIRLAVKPPSKADIDKLARVLHNVHEEDPTIIVEHAPELKQILLHGQGQLQLDLLQYRIEKVYNLHLEFEDPKIPYRETIQSSADASYRHRKQSGGSGQFAEVHMRIEPYTENLPDPSDLNVRNKEIINMETGGSLAFYWCIVGGSIDSKFSNAIKKGVLAKMQEGPLTGSPCMDVRVCVYDGKMHAVDSNDMAFMTAASHCFAEGFENANPQVLEPIYELEVLCEQDVMGDVMSDLQSRRAIIMGMDADGHYQRIKARVPLSELNRYSSALKSLTQGKAKFKMDFVEYAAVMPEEQKKLVQQYKVSLEA